ncbi:LuxR C-terminal-related transcriptional regulator [Pedobacter sp. KLB.chiD]|uniref:LuxR C-terminal-related transcriptional regulator n=1 Tax=Pedobacter sp. KLB.chiD TaxID=3387402 RepID=UPI003999E117
MNIIISDLQDITRRGLISLILDFWPNAHINQLNTYDELKKNLLQGNDAPITIIDPGLLSVPYDEAIVGIKIRAPLSPIIIYTDLSPSLYAIRMIKLGASAYIEKRANEADILLAITAVISGGKYVNDQIKAKIFREFNEVVSYEKELSANELKVANLLIQGQSIKEISKQLNIKQGSVGTFKFRIFKKLQVSNIIQLSEKIK